MPSCAVLFAKDPVAGQVKTRLQPALSAAEAAAVYGAFVWDCAAAVAAADVDRRVVACAPAGATGNLRRLLEPLGAFDFVEQAAGDLGARMEAAVRDSCAAGATRTVIVGSDSPSLPPAAIESGLEQLRRVDVVLGPSTDGGYYLIGMRQPEAGLFGDIAWSTGAVLEQTLAALRPETSLAVLAPWYDVDTPGEAFLLRTHLAALERAGQGRAASSLAALRGLTLPPPS